jgi:hypothetical protein
MFSIFKTLSWGCSRVGRQGYLCLPVWAFPVKLVSQVILALIQKPGRSWPFSKKNPTVGASDLAPPCVACHKKKSRRRTYPRKPHGRFIHPCVSFSIFPGPADTNEISDFAEKFFLADALLVPVSLSVELQHLDIDSCHFRNSYTYIHTRKDHSIF